MAGRLGSDASLTRAVAFLVPLTVLLPSWWIFFDKAIVIARAIGYYKILERAMRDPTSVRCFIGWENALAEFRRRQELGELEFRPAQAESTWMRVKKLVSLRMGHRYWVLIYLVFFWLSVTCLALSFGSAYPRMAGPDWADKPLVLVALGTAACMIGGSAVHNAWMIWQLIFGRHSYTANTQFWEDILQAGRGATTSGPEVSKERRG